MFVLEMNPGTLGTPHEAAASLGVIYAMPYLYRPEFAASAVKRNVANLINKLWDPSADAFDDRPGVRSRVPNKLATMTVALIELAKLSGDAKLLPYAKHALGRSAHISSGLGCQRGSSAPVCAGVHGR